MSESKDVMKTESSELLDLMRQREIRESREYLQRKKQEALAEQAREESLTRMQAIWAQAAETRAIKYARCDHLHGKVGHGYVAPKIRTYILGKHIFPDGTVRIKCEKCGMKWYRTDTKDTLIRDGQKLPNPTHLSFEDAFNLYRESDRDETHSSAAMRFAQVMEPVEK